MTFLKSSLFLFSVGLIPPGAWAASNEEGITVTGRCLKEVAPDRGAITLTADSLDKDLKSALQRSTQAYEKAREAVKKLKLKDAQLFTQEYDVREDKQWENNKMVSKGFRARIGLKVETSEIPRLSEIFQIATNAGIRETSQLQLSLSDAKQLEVETGCLEEATRQATVKAQHVAKALKGSVGKVYWIREGGRDFSMPPMPMMGARMEKLSMAADSGGATVETRAITLRFEVTASFELKP
jgi:uncharacterized protein YggE